MKLTFYGAAKEVTGSCHCLEVGGQKLLIDCGMQQGGDDRDEEALPFNAGLIDTVLVTHAHIDHSGRLPLLVKNGYSGPIYATRATCELLGIMLLDSARIQENDAMWRGKKGRRAGMAPPVPLYTVEDAQAALGLLAPCNYDELVEVCPGVTARFIDAGHLLGSAAIKLELEEEGSRRSIVFSGDVGSPHRPIIRDPQPVDTADCVVMESTYGDRLHEQDNGTVEELAQVIDTTLGRGGNVIIPSFAVGRTQELLYHIREIKERRLVHSVPNFPVYVDSPLALEATQIYSGDLRGYADAETIALLKQGFQPLRFENLNLSRTTDESMFLNTDPTPKVIISSSGMCEAGRVRHHLKHNLWRQECTILFVGFQAANTLGRLLLDGLTEVKLFGETIAVRAQIENFRAMSGHADKNGLISWLTAMDPKPSRVYVVHGEEKSCLAFTAAIGAMGYEAVAPDYTAQYDLITGECLDRGVSRAQRAQKAVARRVSPAYARLLAMGERLLEVIKRNEGGANKDLSKFADQIASLIAKWNR